MALVEVNFLLCSFNIASVEVSHIATGLLIHKHFRQLLPARPVLGFEGSEPAQPLPPAQGSP